MRSTRLAVVVPAALAGVLAAAVPSADAAATWGTTPRTHAATSTKQTVVKSVRIGHHPGFDRLVLTFSGPIPGYDVRYVSTVRRDASGAVVSLLGAAKMRVVVKPTSTTTHAPQGTQTPRYPEIRQVKGAGDFEGVTSYGVGLAAKRPFRVFTLSQPNRLVIDVQLPR